MRIGHLKQTVAGTAETLAEATALPSNFCRSCEDMAPEELAEFIAELAELVQEGSKLLYLAATTLAEE